MELAYKEFLKDIKGIVSKDRIYTDDLRLLAWGTDAGFYRMIPQIVIRSNNEEEVSKLLSIASIIICLLHSVRQGQAFRGKPLVTQF